MTYRAGQQIKFWSEKVFGVPVDAKITQVRKDGRLVIEANFHGTKWTATISPDRVVQPI